MCNVNLLSELPSHCYQISNKMGRMCSTHGMTTNAQDILVRNQEGKRLTRTPIRWKSSTH